MITENLADLSDEFKKTLQDREYILHGQQYPSTEILINLSRLVREKYGVDVFIYREGKENIVNDTLQLIIDGEPICNFTEEFLEDNANTGDKAVDFAKLLLNMIEESNYIPEKFKNAP